MKKLLLKIIKPSLLRCNLFFILLATCKSFLTDLGLLYWEPESYGNWNGYTLGAFDNCGKPTVALDAFK